MLTVDINEKWVSTFDMICLADLALRWPYQAILKILCELDVVDGKLTFYEWKDEATTQEGKKIHLIKQVDANTNIKHLIQKIPYILLLRKTVEHVEKEKPEYKAKKELADGENPLYMTTHKNLREVLPCILWVWQKNSIHNVDFRETIGKAQKDSSSIADLLTFPEEIFESIPEHLFPNFIVDFQSRQKLTTADLTKKFIELCPIKKESDKLLDSVVKSKILC